jgi:hypothetical protein
MFMSCVYTKHVSEAVGTLYTPCTIHVSVNLFFETR